MEFLKKWRTYERITGMSKIARRYFVLNAFDGTITMLGLFVGSFFAGLEHPGTVLVIGLSAASAVAISGVWGAFFAEVAERKRELRELERLLLRRLDKTDVQKAFAFSSYLVAFVDGASPFLASIIVLSPFLGARQGLISVETAYYYSFFLCFLLLFLLGAFLGRISRENSVLLGIKMTTAGALTAAIGFMLK